MRTAISFLEESELKPWNIKGSFLGTIKKRIEEQLQQEIPGKGSYFVYSKMRMYECDLHEFSYSIWYDVEV